MEKRCGSHAPKSTFVLTYLLTPHLAREDEGDVGTEAEERVVLLGLIDL